MQRVGIEQFLQLSKQHPVLDVRSPGEYMHAHIPGAYSLPLFSDDERKVVGPIYKHEGQQAAIKKGLEYFGVKMRPLVEVAERIHAEFHSRQLLPGDPGAGSVSKPVLLLHCWRGGMRSAGMAWLLDLYGFEVYTLAGGYKSFRNWALRQFGQYHHYHILGGYTGSGKTELLQEMAANGHAIVDLEGLARHKGSAFGALGQAAQPTQEMFENELAMAMSEAAQKNAVVWLEDESRRIGNVNIPNALWDSMQLAPLTFIRVPFDERLAYITDRYGVHDHNELSGAVARMKKRLGGDNAKKVMSLIGEGNIKEAFRILLAYYDKCYDKSTNLSGGRTVTTVVCAGTDAATNVGLIPASKQLTNGNGK